MPRPDHGRYALRFERRYRHPPAKVWRVLTEPHRRRILDLLSKRERQLDRMPDG